MVESKELTRNMISGPCDFLFSAGKLQVSCPCQQGIFEADLEASSIHTTCTVCGHALIDHQSGCLTHGKSSCDYSHRNPRDFI